MKGALEALRAARGAQAAGVPAPKNFEHPVANKMLAARMIQPPSGLAVSKDGVEEVIAAVEAKASRDEIARLIRSSAAKMSGKKAALTLGKQGCVDRATKAARARHGR